MCFARECNLAALAATGFPAHGATTAVGLAYTHRATHIAEVLRHNIARLGLEFRTLLSLQVLAVRPSVAVLAIVLLATLNRLRPLAPAAPLNDPA